MSPAMVGSRSAPFSTCRFPRRPTPRSTPPRISPRTSPASGELSLQGELVPGVVRGAGAERLLKFEPPPLLGRGVVGARLRQGVTARFIRLGPRGEPLLAARRIVLCLGSGLRRLHACLPALWIGASLQQRKAEQEHEGKSDASFHSQLFNTGIAILQWQA